MSYDSSTPSRWLATVTQGCVDLESAVHGDDVEILTHAADRLLKTLDSSRSRGDSVLSESDLRAAQSEVERLLGIVEHERAAVRIEIKQLGKGRKALKAYV
jgi:hypothetical protein